MELKVHKDNVKLVSFLEWQSVAVSMRERLIST